MKSIITIILVVIITISSFGQKKIKKLEVKEAGFDVAIEISPKTNKITCDSIFSIEITPVSADELNSLFFNKNQLDGKYHYSYYEKSRDSYFLKKKKVKTEKSDFEFLMEGLDLLLENEVIDQDEYNKLYSYIIADFTTNSGSDLVSTAINISSNPYYLDNKYMNVFKLEISNSSISSAIYDDQLIVKYNNNSFLPLSNDFLRTELKNINQMTTDKSLTLERYNYETPLSIPPQSSVVKYFSVLPIDFSSENLSVYSAKYNKNMNWKVNIKRNDINKTYSFYELQVIHSYGGSESSGKDYTILSTPNPSYIYYDVNKLFVANEAINDVFSLLTFSISNDKLYFCRAPNLAASRYLDLSKNKRSPIKIESFLMDQIKKK